MTASTVVLQSNVHNKSQLTKKNCCIFKDSEKIKKIVWIIITQIKCRVEVTPEIELFQYIYKNTLGRVTSIILALLLELKFSSRGEC